MSSDGKQLGNLSFFFIIYGSHPIKQGSQALTDEVPLFTSSPVTGERAVILWGGTTMLCLLCLDAELAVLFRWLSFGTPAGRAVVLSAGRIAQPGVVLRPTRGFPLFNYSRGLRQLLTQSHVLVISPSLDFLFENNVFFPPGWCTTVQCTLFFVSSFCPLQAWLIHYFIHTSLQSLSIQVSCSGLLVWRQVSLDIYKVELVWPVATLHWTVQANVCTRCWCASPNVQVNAVCRMSIFIK